jgi:hypothetical protein
MSRRAVLFFAFVTAIAACSSVQPDPVPTPRATADARRTAVPDDWAHVMKQVGHRYDLLKDAFAGQPLGDLRDVAAAAAEAAELMQLGYGRFEDPTVPGFARMARDTESWFLQMALEARQAHGDIARELFLAERKQHCGDCHDAHG